MNPSRALAVVLRLALGALLLTMTAIGLWPSCDSSEVPAAIDVGTGGTYGAEISLSVIGRGRVTTNPPAIDCPSDCFARIVLPSASVDGGDGGVTLIAQDTAGAHFVGWSFAEVDLGARGRGPPQCSPMTRKTSVPAAVDPSTVISVPFGETQGTPPPGHEAECAAFTSVSLAYAVTAKFEEDPPIPGFDAAIDPADLDVLFYPTDPSSQANEIGVTSGYAYWRFSIGGRPDMSGVAGSYLASGGPFNEIVAPDQSIRLFHVGRHAVFQTTDGTLRVILAGSTNQGSANTLGGAPTCLALASDAQNVYCRAALDGGSAIYAWPATGGDASAPSIVHLLPPGNDLGVDTQRFYFSEDNSVFDIGPPNANVLSVARDADVDGGSPTFTTLASGQASPFGMSVGPSYLAWFDSLRDGTLAARSASKFVQFPAPPPTGPDAGLLLAATFTPYVAADPITNDYWVGAGNGGNGGNAGWQIYKITAGTSNTTLFRSGAPGTAYLGGLAVDATYVYWTRSNGRIYRAFKNVFDP
jgi:hypothetical protein